MLTHIRVLLIEDDIDDAFLVEEALHACKEYLFDITRADRLSTGNDLLLGEQGYDVVLLDLSLPDSCGIETFIDLYALHVHLPIIVLTGLRDNAMAERMFRLGAQGYLVKGVDDLSLLPHAIQYGIEQFAMREQAKQRFWAERLAHTQQVLHALWPDVAGLPTLSPTDEVPAGYDALVELYRPLVMQLGLDPGEEPAEVAEALRTLVTTLSETGVGPREVLLIHEAALCAGAPEAHTAGDQYNLAQCLLLINVLGALVTAYRDRALAGTVGDAGI